ncbi:MAG: EAL domain-containing protein [Desulfovibrio sp.]|jgi:EAL domain-containing protein (putative c-di-GMP-specific phosphodiesterase class I)|nr:EAL domain-containing protein [Desulfovibrio sp.]
MIPSNENIFPYFQPILCADTYAVSGYEVLGRYIDENGTIRSLGEIFQDPSVPADITFKLDTIVRKKAMLQYSEEKCDKDLYLNMRLEWLAGSGIQSEIRTLKWAREYNIAPEHLVIEITEEEFNTNTDYINVITLFTNAGCRIALDDYGKNASNVDRLAHLSPDIIKIDMGYIHKSPESFHHRAYIHALTSFAERVGVEVLCEGVESQAQLDVCMETGARYFQGFLFDYPQPTTRKALEDCSAFTRSSEKLMSSLYNRVTHTNALHRAMDIHVQNFVAGNVFVLERTNVDVYLVNLMRTLPPHVKRVFLCNRKGKQISGNIERCLGDCAVASPPGANWMWRGFFHEATQMVEAGRQSGVIGAYRDVETKERIFTYFTALNGELFLFADVKRLPLNLSSAAVAA